MVVNLYTDWNTGMCAAIDLIKRNNCRDFIILEKSGGIGGTWNDNRYPVSHNVTMASERC